MFHDDSCPECADHERALDRVNLKTLSIEDLGPVSHSPLFNLNPAALAYFLPRLMEFAVANMNDRDGEPFLGRFIPLIMAGPGQPGFELLGPLHRELIFEALAYIKETHAGTVELAGWADELDQALRNWGG